MTITLPPDIEAPLAEEADRKGTTPERLAVDSLRMLFAPPAEELPSGDETLFDFLAGYVGTVDGSTEPLSEDCGRRFAEGMAEKQRQGHL